MALESANWISQLVIANPTGLDNANTSDDHHRNTKRAVYQSLPNISGEVSASQGELNMLRSATSNIQVQLDALKSGRLLISATAVYSLYANSASYAGNALLADNATSAAFAFSANNATSAWNAYSAAYAYSATNATTAVNASNATNATNATSAVYAFSATNATSAANATNLDSQLGTYYTNASNLVAGTVPAARLGSTGATYQGAGSTIMQYGTTTSLNTASSLVVTYGTAFVGAQQPSVVITGRSTNTGLNGNISVFSDSAAGFTVYNGSGAQQAFNWIALGPSA